MASLRPEVDTSRQRGRVHRTDGWGPKLITGSQGEARLGQATPGATHAGGRREPRVDTERPLDRGIPGALQPTDSCSAAHVHGGTAPSPML